MIQSQGFMCRYFSTKNDTWKKFSSVTDFIIVAGGDGTINKVTEELLQQKRRKRIIPVALLPLGTANNIARTLGISGSMESIINDWHHPLFKKYDVGFIKGLKNNQYFMESLGCGIFARLMREMQKKKNKGHFEMNTAHGLLLKIIQSYKTKVCEIILDGKDYSGNYILVEIMNTRSIGPNLFLSPYSDPGDGKLDVVLMNEKDRIKFLSYISDKIEKTVSKRFHFKTISAKKIIIRTKNMLSHVDDEIIRENLSLKIKIKKGVIKFMLPDTNRVVL